jgi:hypothetical protein
MIVMIHSIVIMTELPKHIAEAKNKFLEETRKQTMIEDEHNKRDCKTIVDAYEKMVMKQMPENISKLLNSNKKWNYDDDGTLIHGDSIKLSKYFMSPYLSCDNESKQRIDELQDIVNVAGNVDLNNIYTSRRYMLVTYKLPDTLFSYFKIGGCTHYVAIK